MIEWNSLLKLVHLLSAAVLSGSGAAIAFFMLMGWRSGDLAGFRLAARNTVLADWIFTTTAVIVQPVSGIALALSAGYSLTAPWLMLTYGLYVFIGACWLPVVGIQMRVARTLAQLPADADIPSEVHRTMRVWFVLGWPAFTALLGIYWLMIAKPHF